MIDSYRHRIRNAAGDPRYAPVEAQLAALPKIGVPTIAIHGADYEMNPVQKSEGHQRFFTDRYERRVVENVGHNPPQEAPEKFARAILDPAEHNHSAVNDLVLTHIGVFPSAGLSRYDAVP